jgi:cob(I)alamin adenosyltransferase
LVLQAELFTLGAELACAPGREDALGIELVATESTTRLETWIDELEQGLPPLKTFVLPGGAPAGALLHQARTICRRAERAVLAAGRLAAVRGEVVTYLNRLSDFLFVLARHENKVAGVPETAWSPRRGS